MFLQGSLIESTTLPITLILELCQLPIVIGNVIVSIDFQLPITKLPISGRWVCCSLDSTGAKRTKSSLTMDWRLFSALPERCSMCLRMERLCGSKESTLTVDGSCGALRGVGLGSDCAAGSVLGWHMPRPVRTSARLILRKEV